MVYVFCNSVKNQIKLGIVKMNNKNNRMVYPSYLNLKIRVQVSILRDCLEILSIWLENKGFIDYDIGIEIPVSSKMKKGKIEFFLKQLTLTEKQEVDAFVQVTNRLFIIISKNQKRENSWVFEFHNSVESMEASGIIDVLNKHRSTAQFFLERYEVTFVRLYRKGNGEKFFPILPLVGDRTHLMLATEKAIIQLFDQPEKFWDYPWDSVDTYGEKILVSRAMKAASNVEFATAIFDQQWELARLAKPNLVKYYKAGPREEEMAVYKSGASRLENVGYVEEEKTYEFSCLLNEDEHIPGWEIFIIEDLVAEGKLADGRIVEIVRVVFWEDEMAHREKRPLLDVGAKVYYQGEEGDIIEITE